MLRPVRVPGRVRTRTAAHAARRYRKQGLDRTGRRMLELVASRGIDGASVLEIGGGVGEIHLELLRQGADRATNLVIVDAYEEPAARLAAEAGVTDRVQRRRLDIATSADDVEPADVVVLHRVVCCYPDYTALLGAAADHARRLLVFSHHRGTSSAAPGWRCRTPCSAPPAAVHGVRAPPGADDGRGSRPRHAGRPARPGSRLAPRRDGAPRVTGATTSSRRRSHAA